MARCLEAKLLVGLVALMVNKVKLLPEWRLAVALRGIGVSQKIAFLFWCY